MLSTIESINSAVNNFIWGVPAMICIIGVGLYLTLRTHFLQIRKFPYAIKTTIGRMFRKRDASDGSLTPFQAVCTALAATVGTGNIAGAATAIASGGPSPSAVPVLSSGCGSRLSLACVPNLLKLPLPYIFVKLTPREILSVDLCII